MSLNPFATVSDYPSMLNKISTYTFFVAVFALALIYWQVPAFRHWMPAMQFKIPETDVQAPATVLLVAFLFAFLSRLVKLHDRLSDLFGIRRHFDVESILMPMAVASGATLSLEQQKTLRAKRIALMTNIFYKYASSSPGKAVIEQHAITMALDQWSWYWICVEAAFVLFVTSVVLAAAGKWSVAFLLVVSVLATIWLLQAIRPLCQRYALDEARQILDDQIRAAAVREQFLAL